MEGAFAEHGYIARVPGCDWCNPDSPQIEQEWNDMAWVMPTYSNKRVDEAGRILAADPLWEAQREAAREIVNNWRASHSYPLQVCRRTLKRRARQIDGAVLVAQRMKRLPSILAKLRRAPNMQLTQMQDLGGCRAVLSTVEQVYSLAGLYEGLKKFDYITKPKPDGYRSIHYVYRYWSKSPKHAAYNGLRIEIQLRSRLQHLWATAVETVSSFTRQDLKAGVGDASWRRFFALMGSEIALREGCPTIPGTPSTQEEIREDLRGLLQQYRLDAALEGWNVAANFMEGEAEHPHTFLIVLNLATQRGIITAFGEPQEYVVANSRYALLERKHADDPETQVALVSVDSVVNLRRAYPNFYLDVGEFLTVVRQVVPKEAH